VRVCIVTPYDLSHDGGVNRHALGLAAALRRLGHQARVLGPASGAAPEGCDCVGGAVPVPANGSVARIGLLVAPGAVRDYLARGRFDLVHVHEPIVPGPGRHALRFAKVPVVATFHANDERELPLVRALRAAASGALGRVDFGIAVSRAAKAFSRAIYRGRVAVVPNGVDGALFSATTSSAQPLPRGAPEMKAAAPQDQISSPPPGAAGEGEPGERLRILFVGRFGEERKGFRLLLEAVALLRGAGDDVVLDVVGVGPAGRFQPRARRLGVRFHGRLCDAALAARYRAADVFCAPSIRGESFGLVLLEAMAAGCPVVASDLPGYGEAARGAALLVPPADPAALAVALRRAGGDGALRARLVAAGLSRAGSLSWTAIASRVLHVYRAAATDAAPALERALDATA
jgi:phosphatidylinositol alpha-mannosyltransferase